jgi:hypothetical protein
MTSKEIMIFFSEYKMKPLKTLGNVPLVILVATVTKPGSGHGGNTVNSYFVFNFGVGLPA